MMVDKGAQFKNWFLATTESNGYREGELWCHGCV